jgi:hypothetical protein
MVRSAILLRHQRAPLFAQFDWHLFMHNGSAAKHSLVHAREHCSAAVTGFFCGVAFSACVTDAMQSNATTAINLVMATPAPRYARVIPFSTGPGPLSAKALASAFSLKADNFAPRTKRRT